MTCTGGRSAWRAVGQPARPRLQGFSGQITAGSIRAGQRIRVMPSGRESTVERVVVTYVGDREHAVPGLSVTLTLADEIDISCGDVVAAATDPPAVADQFETHIIWMDEKEMLPGRPYLLKIGTHTTGVTIHRPGYKFRAERCLARQLLGDGEFVEVYVNAPLALAESRDRKGLYAKARKGDLVHFAGIDTPYEPPETPDIRLEPTGAFSAEQSADRVIRHLIHAGIVRE